jgi:hypothetical protein
LAEQARSAAEAADAAHARDLLEAARPDVLAFTAFPKELWRQIWSNNPLSVNRLNLETTPAHRVVGIFCRRGQSSTSRAGRTYALAAIRVSPLRAAHASLRRDCTSLQISRDGVARVALRSAPGGRAIRNKTRACG